jgi:hypothetical protein
MLDAALAAIEGKRAWHKYCVPGVLTASKPALSALQPDVEALLVNRARGARQYFVVPIDACYRTCRQPKPGHTNGRCYAGALHV